MRTKRLVFPALGRSAVLLVACSITVRAQTGNTPAPQSPPVAPVRPVIDDYHGTKVSDPYRYMENLQDPEVQAWFKAQDDYTRAVLGRVSRQQATPRPH